MEILKGKKLRTKFKVKFSAYSIHKELSFTDTYIYLGYNITDCLIAFQNYWNSHYGPQANTERRIYTINEVTREENIPDDYSCGHVGGIILAGDKECELVVTQITSDRVFILWSPVCYKVVEIFLDKPREFIDTYELYPHHYGKGMDKIRIGDMVEYTCEYHSLLTGLCSFFNPTGENRMGLAKKMYDYMLKSESPVNKNPFDRPGKYTEYGWNRLKQKGVAIKVQTPYDDLSHDFLKGAI